MSVEVKRTKKELESLSREPENVTIGDLMNKMFIIGIEDGRIKGKELKEFWRKSIVRCHLNHFNSSEERWKFCRSLMSSILTEEEYENAIWEKNSINSQFHCLVHDELIPYNSK